MTSEIEKFYKELEDMGVEMEDLDDLVHDTASLIASNINNSSLEEQVNFLLANGVSTDYVRKWVKGEA